LTKRILVIGTLLEGRADCVIWSSAFPNIEEYDGVVVDFQSLYQSRLDALYRDEGEWEKVERASREIGTLLENGREVFCLINEPIFPTLLPGEPKARHGPVPSNYSILPTYPYVTRKEGTSKIVVSKRFLPYMDQVGKWCYELEHKWLNPIARNKSGKSIAGTVSYGKGSIHFLPPPTECTREEAIEMLHDLILKPSTTRHPAWRAQIAIPGMDAVEEQIRELRGKTEALEKQLERLESEKNRLDRFRDLMSPTGTGDYLESLVKDVLEGLGIKTSKAPPGFPVDLLGSGFAVEVTGITKGINVRSEKYGQTLRFLERHHGEKLLLVANTHKHIDPRKRPPQNFSELIVEHLKARHVCMLTTARLHQLWTAVWKGDLSKEAAVKLLKDTDGVL
jgi:hypothetical protein